MLDYVFCFRSFPSNYWDKFVKRKVGTVALFTSHDSLCIVASASIHITAQSSVIKRDWRSINQVMA